MISVVANRATTGLVVTLLWAAPVFAADYSLTAEAGPEIDSNVLRAPRSSGEVVTAGLMRMTAEGQFRLRGGRHSLALIYGGGAKVFFGGAASGDSCSATQPCGIGARCQQGVCVAEARSADEALHRLRARWSLRLGRATALTLGGGFYDVFQRESERDFRAGDLLAGVSIAHRSGTVGSLQLGYRGLDYKPLGEFSFHALAGRLSVSRELSTRDDFISWRLGLVYDAALRFYEGPVRGPPEPCPDNPQLLICSPEQDGRRRDLAQTVRASVDYTGEAQATLYYALEVNRSNTYGESFVRQAVGLKFTTSLLLGVYLTTKGVLQFSRFKDPFLTGRVGSQQSRFVDIDDENRSTLELRLARDFGDRWALVTRYALYLNETRAGAERSVIDPGFLRHLLFVGVRLRYDSGGG